MSWLNIIGFLIIGFVAVFSALFIIVCIFDETMEKNLKLVKHDELDSKEIE